MKRAAVAITAVLSAAAGMEAPASAPRKPFAAFRCDDSRHKYFADVVLSFNQTIWIAESEPLDAFDCNGKGWSPTPLAPIALQLSPKLFVSRRTDRRPFTLAATF